MDVSLGDEDMKKLIPYANFVPYNEIKYMTLDEILGKHRCAYILYLINDTYGHWVCLIETNGKLSYFNSYGEEPDDDFRFITKEYRIKLNEIEPHLFELMAKSGMPCEYNNIQLQKREKGINTCGRHVCLRIWNSYLDIDDYNKYLLNVCKLNNMTPDQVVIHVTKKYLGK